MRADIEEDACSVGDGAGECVAKVCVQAANGRFSALLRVVLPLHCHHPRLGFPFLRHLLLAFHHSLAGVSSLVCIVCDMSVCASQFERL